MSIQVLLPDKPDILTYEEMVELTDARQTKGQIKWLDDNEYIYEIYADGWPRVHRIYLMCRMMKIDPAGFVRGSEKWQLDTSTIS